MYCSNCGKELDDNSKVCDVCGSLTSFDEANTQANDIETNMSKLNVGSKSQISSILKNKKFIISLAFCLICFIIVAILSLGTNSVPEGLVKFDSDDMCNGYAFDLTMDEFIERYNNSVRINVEPSDIDELSINISNFTVEPDAPGISIYKFYKGEFIWLNMGFAVYVSDASQKIVGIQYIYSETTSIDNISKLMGYTMPNIIFGCLSDDICDVLFSFDDSIGIYKNNVIYLNSYRNIGSNSDWKDLTVMACDKDSTIYQRAKESGCFDKD